MVRWVTLEAVLRFEALVLLPKVQSTLGLSLIVNCLLQVSNYIEETLNFTGQFAPREVGAFDQSLGFPDFHLLFT